MGGPGGPPRSGRTALLGGDGSGLKGELGSFGKFVLWRI